MGINSKTLGPWKESLRPKWRRIWVRIQGAQRRSQTHRQARWDKTFFLWPLLQQVAKALTIAILIVCYSIQSPADDQGHKAHCECVILLHGLGRTANSMNDMAGALKAAGFTTINLDYPSRDFPIEKLAMDTIPKGIQTCRELDADKFHFVTHSMGGILLRYYLTQRSIKDLGRVVMLSPPNQGSEVADVLKDNPLYRWYNGPAGQQLGTGPDGFIARLGPVRYPVGVITGNKHALYDTWFSDKIPGEDDGKVSVKRAKVAGMADFLVLPQAHTFIMEKPDVTAQTIHFLRHGIFQHLTKTQP